MSSLSQSMKSNIEKLTNEFFKERKILLKNLPIDYDTDSIKMEILKIAGKHTESNSSLNLELKTGLREAILTFEEFDIEEMISKLDNSKIYSNVIVAERYWAGHIVCVCRLPESMTHTRFSCLMQAYAPIRKSFVVNSCVTDKCSGYGLVEFDVSDEDLATICSDLDCVSIGGRTLQCDIVHHESTVGNLLSRCIIVDNLPSDFHDADQLRQIFGFLATPVYCEIAATKDGTKKYGVIEFSNIDDLDRTIAKVQNETVSGQTINCFYSIAGYGPADVYSRMLGRCKKRYQFLPTVNRLCQGNPLLRHNSAMLNSTLIQELFTENDQLIQVFAECMDAFCQFLEPECSEIDRDDEAALRQPLTQLGILIILALVLYQNKKPKDEKSEILEFLSLYLEISASLKPRSESTKIITSLFCQTGSLARNLIKHLETRAGKNNALTEANISKYITHGDIKSFSLFGQQISGFSVMILLHSRCAVKQSDNQPFEVDSEKVLVSANDMKEDIKKETEIQHQEVKKPKAANSKGTSVGKSMSLNERKSSTFPRFKALNVSSRPLPSQSKQKGLLGARPDPLFLLSLDSRSQTHESKNRTRESTNPVASSSHQKIQSLMSVKSWGYQPKGTQMHMPKSLLSDDHLTNDFRKSRNTRENDGYNYVGPSYFNSKPAITDFNRYTRGTGLMDRKLIDTRHEPRSRGVDPKRIGLIPTPEKNSPNLQHNIRSFSLDHELEQHCPRFIKDRRPTYATGSLFKNDFPSSSKRKAPRDYKRSIDSHGQFYDWPKKPRIPPLL